MKYSRAQVFIKRMLIAVPATLLLTLTGSGFWLLRSDSGAAWLWGQLEERTAGALSASAVDGNLATGFVIRNLLYQSDGVDLSVNRLKIQVVPGWWPVSVQVEKLAIEDVVIVNKVTGEPAKAVSGDTDIGTALSALDLPVTIQFHNASISNIMLQKGENIPEALLESIRFIAVLDRQLVVDQLEIKAAGVSANLIGYLQLQAPFDLAATLEGRVDVGDESAGFDLKLPFSLMAQGQIDNWSFELDTDMQVGPSHSSRLAISGTGSSNGIELQSASLSGQGVDLDIQGKLDWTSALEADFDVVIRQLDLSPWVKDWPVGKSIEGKLDLNWSPGGLAVEVCALTVNGTDLRIDIEANMDMESNRVSAGVNWSHLNWPLADAKPAFSSPAGRLTASGSIDQWTASGQLEIQLGEYPRGAFEVQGDGTRGSAHLVISKGDVLGGTMSGEASADWSAELSWTAYIHAEGVNPEAVFKDWPGQLDAELEIDTNGLDRRMKISLPYLKGRIRGVQVHARGGFIIVGDNVSFDDVEVRVDEAVLLLDGNASEPGGVTMSFSGELPALFLRGVSGSLEAEGRYSSHVDGPLFELNMEAMELDWNDYHIKGLSVSSAGSGPVPELQLDATDVRLPGVLLDRVSLGLNPVGDKHRLRADISGENYAFSSEVILVPVLTDKPYSGAWRGSFKEMNISFGQSYIFSLNETAALKWSPLGSVLEPLCLSETAGARFCLSGDYQANDGWSVIVDVTAIPFDYMQDLFEMDIHFEQMLEGRVEWHQAPGRAPAGGADLRITAGKIFDVEDNVLLAETREGRFAFALRNGNLESGSLDLEFVDTGFIDVDFDVLGIVDNGARLLQGRAFVQLDNIRMLGQLALPGVDEIGGRFESTITLGGTLTDPVFDGGFKLTDGLIEYAPIGLRLEEIEFEGWVEKLDRGSFKGNFRVGEGLGSIDGRFTFENVENIQLDVELSGERLLLTNTDVLKLRTDTNLKLGLSPGRLDINGHIMVPSARFSPENLYLGGITDSQDLMIEPSGGAVVIEADARPASNYVFGELELTFGDDVLIQLPGVETSFSGSVVFQWNGEPLPTAQGSYVLDGTVDVYGPKLQINEGHISFPDVPADNPLLNIRAEREIYGNTQIRSAGVQVIGSLKRPVLEAYTVPVTNEDRAWTLLITGTDFDQGQGVGGFDVGTYIAPRLYVSYGISLFEDENVISARYDLKKGFGVKVTSGQRETGLDVSYTIDK